MSFSGTLDKCKACDKTVYVVDSLSIDGVPFHKSCFKCTHCKAPLPSMSNYSSMDGVLYCKPHFEQLFKETGSFSKGFHAAPKPGERQNELQDPPLMFSGTQDKCSVCKKTAYPLEKVTVEGEAYHKTCFRCSHGGGVLYCKHHFAQLFMEKGSYTHILKHQASSVRRAAPPDHPSSP
ncbi:unnamed protein product [Spirodela intermedia]|uniref:LIM zinc-binding domain-containing protein n=1 Tax=Spirodela intermedia TaxID=51605 RepID=A0ABN7EBH0_SPIIN|nr:unnamed protein product [Spirodela intermedia]